MDSAKGRLPSTAADLSTIQVGPPSNLSDSRTGILLGPRCETVHSMPRSLSSASDAARTHRRAEGSSPPVDRRRQCRDHRARSERTRGPTGITPDRLSPVCSIRPRNKQFEMPKVGSPLGSGSRFRLKAWAVGSIRSSHGSTRTNSGADGWISTPSSTRGVVNDALAIYFADVTIRGPLVSIPITSSVVLTSPKIRSIVLSSA